MIKHIVCFKMKDNVEGSPGEDNLRNLKSMLEELKSSIKEVKHIEVGVNISDRPQAMDLILYSEFSDNNDLQVYRNHPEHVKVVEYIKKVCSELRVVDYEIL